MNSYKFYKQNVHGDWVVVAIQADEKGYRKHFPMVNFGDRQFEAIEFAEHDAKELSDQRVAFLIKTYDPEHRVMQIPGRPGCFRKLKTEL